MRDHRQADGSGGANLTGLPMHWETDGLSQILLGDQDMESLRGSPYTNEATIKRLVRRINDVELPVFSWASLAERFDRISKRDRDDVVRCFRHGTTKYNQRNLVSGQHDTVLAPLARQQAAEISATLPLPLDLIVCSAMSRTIQTMALSVPHSLLYITPIVIDPRLNEVNLGYLQGRKRIFLPQFEAGDIDYAPPGGESYREAAQRVLSSMADIFDILASLRGRGRAAVIFCHAGVIRIFSSLTRESRTQHALFHLDLHNAGSITISSRNIRLAQLWVESYR